LIWGFVSKFFFFHLHCLGFRHPHCFGPELPDCPSRGSVAELLRPSLDPVHPRRSGGRRPRAPAAARGSAVVVVGLQLLTSRLLGRLSRTRATLPAYNSVFFLTFYTVFPRGEEPSWQALQSCQGFKKSVCEWIIERKEEYKRQKSKNS
jgi:hypothetical protein